MKYRKKPVVIEAEEWQPGREVKGVCYCQGPTFFGKHLPHVHTLEGAMCVSSGDMIITGIKGELYPCKPEIFAATYEPA